MTVGDIINQINFISATIDCLKGIEVVDIDDSITLTDAQKLLKEYIGELKRKSVK